MRINRKQMEQYGLGFLLEGRQMYIPVCFQKEIHLLLDKGETIAAIVQAKHFKDYAVYVKIMCLLNRLVRYYQRPVIIYCLSYRVKASGEKKYLIFSQRPKGC